VKCWVAAFPNWRCCYPEQALCCLRYHLRICTLTWLTRTFLLQFPGQYDMVTELLGDRSELVLKSLAERNLAEALFADQIGKTPLLCEAFLLTPFFCCCCCCCCWDRPRHEGIHLQKQGAASLCQYPTDRTAHVRIAHSRRVPSCIRLLGQRRVHIDYPHHTHHKTAWQILYRYIPYYNHK